MSSVTVVGGGPAGAMAALSALETGAGVTLYEKSVFPRHKVCGEFLSGEAVATAKRLGVWNGLLKAGAVPIHNLLLQVGNTRLSAPAPAPLFGLSRFTLDDALLREVERRGARIHRERMKRPARPAVMAVGRTQAPVAGVHPRDRLFGFKAHFTGPVGDAVELYLFHGCYVGVSPVEGGRTNVCGLGPLRLLGESGIEPERLFTRCAPLRDRLSGLRREWDWLATGPVNFGWKPEDWSIEGVYPAGDALGFLDPFTGAGQSVAMIEGVLAGRAAARKLPLADYLRDCRRATRRAFAAARIIRLGLRSGLAGFLAQFLPAELLFRATRPRLAA